MKRNQILTLFVFITVLASCQKQNTNYTLNDFFKNNVQLDKFTDSVYSSLSDTQRIAQMIITSAGELGKPKAVVKQLAEKGYIGGVVFLRNSEENHIQQVNELNNISADNHSIGLLFSMDAEPSLFNGRILGSTHVPNTIDLSSVGLCDSVTEIICDELKSIGIHQNYAPVVDISPDNKAIKNRSFGRDEQEITELAGAFTNTTQKNGIIATAKHFPGHGLVHGDTHKQSVYIDGEFQELSVYPPLIEQGIISIMIAHVSVRNNKYYSTDGMPSSCSRRIVTDLLKDSLNFRGIVVSDALGNMNAVSTVENPSLVASMAGCDLILMPKDEEKTIDMILHETAANESYKMQVEESVKKIIRLKICCGIIKV